MQTQKVWHGDRTMAAYKCKSTHSSPLDPPNYKYEKYKYKKYKHKIQTQNTNQKIMGRWQWLLINAGPHSLLPHGSSSSPITPQSWTSPPASLTVPPCQCATVPLWQPPTQTPSYLASACCNVTSSYCPHIVTTSGRASHQLKPSSSLHISIFFLSSSFFFLKCHKSCCSPASAKSTTAENTLDISMMYNYTEMHTYISFRSLVIECDKWKHISKWNGCKGMTHACKAAAQDRQLFTTAQQWEQIGILGRFVISPEDLLFLPRFVIPGKICCSHSQLVSSGFNTKVAACPDQRQQNHLHNYWNFSTSSVLF